MTLKLHNFTQNIMTRQTRLLSHLVGMNSAIWQLQEAKSRFSDLVNKAISQGAQTVTRHGRPAVVVISAEEYRQYIAPRPSLAAALNACPENLSPLVDTNRKRLARNIDFRK